MKATWPEKEETRVLQAMVDLFPESDAHEIAEMALERLIGPGPMPEPLDVEFVFERLRHRAATEWKCPEI